MSNERKRTLVSPRCVERPSFLWFKQRRHEPSERLTLFRSWGSIIRSPIHARVDYSETSSGYVRHVVAVMCKHCEQAYFTDYDWRQGGSISWRGIDEEYPDVLNAALQRAQEKWHEDRAREAGVPARSGEETNYGS